ncbi:hypothetical protein OHB12_05215 [Nocardia sp. NBC_01730]|uniref:hypothetical protein n=1 Tax=Nocardia sp. NBC_01730 TaxID=2975998 RepID=UPI002E15EC5D|nr:hypothetical protein OHB12_05215 [Nocardia sp. NBC_01730]
MPSASPSDRDNPAHRKALGTVMIDSGKELLAWIQANLPTLDEDLFEPWLAGPACPSAVTAEIQVRIHSAGTVDRVTAITLSAAPIANSPDALSMPLNAAAVHPDSR